MSKVAGHDFTGLDGRCTCGKRFADIAGSTTDDIGQLYVAHVGALNAAELSEIEAERERRWAARTAPARGGGPVRRCHSRRRTAGNGRRVGSPWSAWWRATRRPRRWVKFYAQHFDVPQPQQQGDNHEQSGTRTRHEGARQDFRVYRRGDRICPLHHGLAMLL